VDTIELNLTFTPEETERILAANKDSTEFLTHWAKWAILAEAQVPRNSLGCEKCRPRPDGSH
jgi:hypothetical protein